MKGKKLKKAHTLEIIKRVKIAIDKERHRPLNQTQAYTLKILHIVKLHIHTQKAD